MSLGDDSEIDWKAFDAATKTHLRELRTRLPTIVGDRVKQANSWHDEVVSAFGNEFEWKYVQERLRDTVTKSHRIGKFGCREVTADALKQRIRAIDSISDSLNDAKLLAGKEIEFGKALSVLAGLDETNMHQAHDLIITFRRFLDETSASIVADLGDSPHNLDEVAIVTNARFQNLSEHWNEIVELCK